MRKYYLMRFRIDWNGERVWESMRGFERWTASATRFLTVEAREEGAHYTWTAIFNSVGNRMVMNKILLSKEDPNRGSVLDRGFEFLTCLDALS